SPRAVCRCWGLGDFIGAGSTCASLMKFWTTSGTCLRARPKSERTGLARVFINHLAIPGFGRAKHHAYWWRGCMTDRGRSGPKRRVDQCGALVRLETPEPHCLVLLLICLTRPRRIERIRDQYSSRQVAVLGILTQMLNGNITHLRGIHLLWNAE